MKRPARVALFSAASILSSVSALAADLPARAPVAPIAYVPAFSWTGFYLGGALGWIETNPEYTTGALVLGTPFIVSSASSKNGLSYGILSGYNYQMGQVVLGVEGDFHRLDRRQDTVHLHYRRFSYRAQQVGWFDPWTVRLCCRPRSVLPDGRRSVRLQ
jgi:opacity protein-like surface antigen